MQHNTTETRRPKWGEWICGFALAVAIGAFLTPVLADAKERAASSNLSSLKASARATSLYSLDYDSAAPQTGCLQEGAFVTANGGCMDTQTGVVWGEPLDQQFGPGGNEYPNFYQATSYCAASEDGGFLDWRLPAAAEMQAAALHGAEDYLAGSISPGSLEFSSTTRRGGKEVFIVSLSTGDGAWVLIQTKYGGTIRYSRLRAHCVRGPG